METKEPFQRPSQIESQFGSTIKFLGKLNEKLKRVPLRPIVERYSEAETLKLPIETAENVIDSQKVEINGIAGYFLQQIWPSVQEWKRQHKPGLSTLPAKDKPLKELSEDRVVQSLEQDKSIEDMEIFLQFIAVAPMDYFIGSWEVSRSWENSERDRKIYGRLEKMLYLRQLENGKELASPGTALLASLSEADDITWELIRCLPRVFKNQFLRSPSESELAQLLENTESLILTLSGGSSIIMGLLRFSLTGLPMDRRVPGQFHGLSYDLDKLYISEKNGKYLLEIRPEVLADVESLLDLVLRLNDFSKIPQVVTGCSALAVKGVDGKSMVHEFYEERVKLYKQFIAPALLKGEKPWNRKQS